MFGSVRVRGEVQKSHARGEFRMAVKPRNSQVGVQLPRHGEPRLYDDFNVCGTERRTCHGNRVEYTLFACPNCSKRRPPGTSDNRSACHLG